MFTGLIETVGTVRRLVSRGGGSRLEVDAVWPGSEIPRTGESIAVNGACLTVVDPTPAGFSADVSQETLRRTTLGELKPGDSVNLERALRIGDRLGGHLVQGHVDATVRLLTVTKESDFQRWRLSLSSEQAAEVVKKGSIAVQGVSLTVAETGPGWFEVALIPATLATTTFGSAQPGSRLHIETDIIGKYVAQQVGGNQPSALEKIFGGGPDA